MFDESTAMSIFRVSIHGNIISIFKYHTKSKNGCCYFRTEVNEGGKDHGKNIRH
jgi:hypothetical protein